MRYCIYVIESVDRGVESVRGAWTELLSSLKEVFPKIRGHFICVSCALTNLSSAICLLLLTIILIELN